MHSDPNTSPPKPSHWFTLSPKRKVWRACCAPGRHQTGIRPIFYPPVGEADNIKFIKLIPDVIHSEANKTGRCCRAGVTEMRPGARISPTVCLCYNHKQGAVLTFLRTYEENKGKYATGTMCVSLSLRNLLANLAQTNLVTPG